MKKTFLVRAGDDDEPLDIQLMRSDSQYDRLVDTAAEFIKHHNQKSNGDIEALKDLSGAFVHDFLDRLFPGYKDQ